MEMADRLAAVLGAPIRTGNPDELRFCCPECRARKGTPDRKYHMYLNTRKGAWFCFRCSNKGRDLSRFLGKNAIVTQPTDNWELLDRAMGALVGTSNNTVAERVSVAYPCETVPVYDGADAWRYLVEQRRMSPEDVSFYRMVFGYMESVPRVFVPTFSHGELVYWVGRKFFTLDPSPKYMNPSIAKDHVFNLDRVNLDYPVIITEGVFSGIACGRNGVSLFGKSPTMSQIRRLLECQAQDFVVALDGDALPEALEIGRFLLYGGKSVSFVQFDEGDDPDSVASIDEHLNSREVVDIEFLARMEIDYGRSNRRARYQKR